jgi:CubicO group peptidase (beta-lactamase class C family)
MFTTPNRAAVALIRATLMSAAVLATTACTTEDVRRPQGQPGARLANSRSPLPDSAIVALQNLAASIATTSTSPSLSIAAAHADTLLFAHATGHVDAEREVPATTATLYRIGSLSKLLTVVAAARLQDRGDISFEWQLTRLAPEFGFGGATVTLRQLAAHTGGVRHYGPGEYFNRTHHDSLASAVRRFTAETLSFTPGSRYLYSSYGYNLFGIALERAARRPFVQMVDSLVLFPLGMTETMPDSGGTMLPNRATTLEVRADGTIQTAATDDLSDRWPSGGYLSTARDMAHFGATFGNPSFMRPSTLQLITTLTRLPSGEETGAGLGWRIGSDAAGRTIWHHAGASVGGRAVLVVWPGENLAICLLANATSGLELTMAYQVADVIRASRTRWHLTP